MTASICSQVKIPSSPRATRGMHPPIADMQATSYKFTSLRSSQIPPSPPSTPIKVHLPPAEKARPAFSPKSPPPPPPPPVTRRVFSIRFVPSFRLRHRPPHLRRRSRHGIAPQVHHSLGNLPCLCCLVRIH